MLAGLLGFLRTSGVAFAGEQGKSILGLEVNPLHNIVHLAIGALLIAGAAGGYAAARRMNILVGVAYLATFLLGLFMANKEWDFLALNGADNILHLVTGALALGIGLRRERETARGT